MYYIHQVARNTTLNECQCCSMSAGCVGSYVTSTVRLSGGKPLLHVSHSHSPHFLYDLYYHYQVKADMTSRIRNKGQNPTLTIKMLSKV